MLLSSHQPKPKDNLLYSSRKTTRKIVNTNNMMISLSDEESDYKAEEINYTIEDSEVSSSEEELTQSKNLFKNEPKSDTLENHLKIKDEEIKNLQKALLEDKSFTDLLNSENHHEDQEEFKANRIRELSKKSKRLLVSYERERSKNSQLNIKLKALEDANIPIQLPARKIQSSGELRTTKEKLSHVTRRLEEERMQNQICKSEIRNLQKALQRELGPLVSIEKVLKDDGSHKPKQEQICILKDKVKELKLRLDNTPSQTNGLKKLETSKQKSIEKLTNDLEKTISEMKSLKTKYDAIVSRYRTQELNMKDLKEKLQILFKKGENDDRLIEVLQKELRKSKDDEQNNILYSNLRDLCAEQQKEIQTLQGNINQIANGPDQMLAATFSLEMELKELRKLYSESEKRLLNEKDMNEELCIVY
jgi:hypothetical protein